MKGREGDIQATVFQKSWEELLEDRVRNVLHLTTHTHCLGAHVHGEHLSGPDPSRGAPRRLVEEAEEEEQEDDGDADGM